MKETVYPTEEITEERIKKGIDDALENNSGYFVGINGDNGPTLKMRYDGERVGFKIGRSIFETESIEDMELVYRFIGCVLSRHYN